jgi:hypothetical protein
VARRPNQIEPLPRKASHRFAPRQAVRRTLKTTDPKAFED